MLVVSDASPVNVLVRIGCVEVLGNLFGRVIVPTAVAAELTHPNTPSIVRDWIAKLPAWVEVKRPTRIEPIPRLDPGELEAIALARELSADLLLIDDRAGRRAAVELNIPIAGTLGILERAARAGRIVFEDAIRRIGETDFAISDE